MRCAIWYQLSNFKIEKNIYGGVLLLVNCNFIKSDSPPGVFLTFFKLYYRYQIVQSITYFSQSWKSMEYQCNINKHQCIISSFLFYLAHGNDISSWTQHCLNVTSYPSINCSFLLHWHKTQRNLLSCNCLTQNCLSLKQPINMTEKMQKGRIWKLYHVCFSCVFCLIFFLLFSCQCRTQSIFGDTVYSC